MPPLPTNLEKGGLGTYADMGLFFNVFLKIKPSSSLNLLLV